MNKMSVYIKSKCLYLEMEFNLLITLFYFILMYLTLNWSLKNNNAHNNYSIITPKLDIFNKMEHICISK